MRTLTKTLMAFALIGFLMTSCGGGSEVCGCADSQLAMMKDMKTAGREASEDKIKEIEEKYKAKMEKCQKLGEGKKEDELKKMQEEMEKCPSYTEMKKMMDGE